MMQKDRELLISLRKEEWELHAKIRSEEEDKKKDWEKRRKEDIEFIKKSSILRIFNNASDLLWRATQPEFIAPKDKDKLENVYISLSWGEIYFDDFDAWGCAHSIIEKKVLCFVARQEGKPVGFRFNDSEEIVPAEKEILSSKLAEVIKSTPLKKYKLH